MQRMMLAAVRATAERLIAIRYLLQIFAHLTFSYTKRILFTLQKLVTMYWMYLWLNLICIKSFARKKKNNNGMLLVTGQFQLHVAVFNA